MNLLAVVLAAFAVVGVSAQGSGRGAAAPGAPPLPMPDGSSTESAPPPVLTRVDAEYTDKARQARIQGEVKLSVMVLPDGRVGTVTIDKSLDTRYGLDYRAVSAVRQWLFRPRLIDGHPVQSLTTVTVPFRLSGVNTGWIPPDLSDEVVGDLHLMTERGMMLPRLKGRVDPVYTSAAMRAKITGSVLIRAVVKSDGTIANAHIMKSLDHELGLDQQALGAVRLWTFEPATLNGVPVATQVQIQLEFRLH